MTGKNEEIESILNGIDFQSLAFTAGQWKLIRAAAIKLHEIGPLAKIKLSEGFQVKPGTLVRQALAPANSHGIFNREDAKVREKGDSGRLATEWSVDLDTLKLLRTKHAVTPDPTPVSLEELNKQLLPDIYDLAIGLSHNQSDRLFCILRKLSEGAQDTRTVADYLGIHKKHALEALSNGARLGLLNHRSRVLSWNHNGEVKKPRGRKPDLWFHNVEGIRSFKNRFLKKQPEKSYMSQLAVGKRAELESVDFDGDGLTRSQAQGIAECIARIWLAGGNLTIPKREFGISDRHRLLAIEKKYIRTKRHKAGCNSYTVNERKLKNRTSKNPAKRSLGTQRTRVPLYNRWPQIENWSERQREIINAIDARIAGRVDPEVVELLGVNRYRWRSSKPILAAVGTSRRATYYKLAQSLRCLPGVVEYQIKAMVEAGWYAFSAQPGWKDWESEECMSLHCPDWPKLEALSGDNQKPAGNASKKTAGEKKADAARGGQKPDKRNRTCDWVDKWRDKNPGSTLEQARRAYVSKHPGDPISLDGLKKAFRRRRTNSLK